MTHIKEDPLLPLEEEYWENIDVNDCGYLLRTLEREAYSSVVSALRAKGPPSEHTFLLLDHLKSALSINDELGRAEIRRAAYDPKLCKVAKVLNPSYDTCTEWSTSSSEARGSVEARPSREKPFANTSTSSIADQLLSKATSRNEHINRSTGRAFELLSLPHKPYVPERLRLLLRETNRAEQRIAPPLEALPPPVPVSTSADRTSRSEARPPPPKKRKQRISKGPKIRETPPALLAQKNAVKVDDGPSIEQAILATATQLIAAAAPPTTPVAASAAAPAPVAAASAASAASVVTPATPATPATPVTPAEPPQSGDAMKTWVSKIHQEQELAASAAKRNGAISPVEMCAPSTSAAGASSLEDSGSGKKKRRPRAPIVDPYYLNSSARTRPFIFEKWEGGVNGKQKPPRGNPDKRLSSTRASPGIIPYQTPLSAAASSAANPGLITSATPTARPHVDNYLTTHGVNSRLEETAVAATLASMASMTKQSSPNRVPMKRGMPMTNSVRVPPKYIVNNSGVAMPSTSMRAPTTGGIGGRTASLGSQQLSSMHGFSSGVHFTSQKASASTSNSSVHSIGGGSTGSGIGASSSNSSLAVSDPLHPISALPPEEAGHDYSSLPPPPPHVVAAAAAAKARQAAAAAAAEQAAPGMRDPTGGLRLTPRVPARPRLANPMLRTPAPSLSSHPSPQHHLSALNGLPSTSSLSSALQNPLSTALNAALASSSFHITTSTSSIPPPPLQRTGSQSSMRPRTGSRGAVGGLPSGSADVATEGEIKTRVQNILIEAAQKECANGKRPSVPRDLIRENGIVNQVHSPSPSVQSPQHFAVCRPSTSAEAASSLAKTPILASLTSPSTSTPFPPFSSQPSTSFNPSSMEMRSFFGGGVGGGQSTSSTPFIPSNLHSTPSPSAIFPPVGQLALEKLLQIARNEATEGGDTPVKNYLLGQTAQWRQQQQSPTAAGPSSVPATTPVAPPPPPPPRPPQRQYMLQPEGMSYAEFKPDNPLSYKSFASDGTPLQYNVSPEELYDQGILARPSTSGLNGVNGGMRRPQQNASPLASSFAFPPTQIAAAAAAAQLVGVPTSFSIPSNEARGENDIGEMPPMTRDGMAFLQRAPPTLPPSLAAAAAAPPPPSAIAASHSREEGTSSSSEVKDILEQSCRELQ